MRPNPDFRDIFAELNAAKARYLLVGAYALAAHGLPRATKGLDIWVEPTEDNGLRVLEALNRFGAPVGTLQASESSRADFFFKMGVEPVRIDVLTKSSGVAFADAWPRRVESTYGDQKVFVLGLEELLANKKASGREQDLLDVKVLEKLQAKSARP